MTTESTESTEKDRVVANAATKAAEMEIRRVPTLSEIESAAFVCLRLADLGDESIPRWLRIFTSISKIRDTGKILAEVVAMTKARDMARG